MDAEADPCTGTLAAPFFKLENRLMHVSPDRPFGVQCAVGQGTYRVHAAQFGGYSQTCECRQGTRAGPIGAQVFVYWTGHAGILSVSSPIARLGDLFENAAIT